jgi:hypothetical protein
MEAEMNRMTPKELAIEMTQFAEQLYLQNTAYRAAASSLGDIALVSEFAKNALDPALKLQTHQLFAGVYALIESLDQEWSAKELQSKMPPVPKVEKS